VTTPTEKKKEKQLNILFLVYASLLLTKGKVIKVMWRSKCKIEWTYLRRDYINLCLFIRKM
jgi:hypothetical protein